MRVIAAIHDPDLHRSPKTSHRCSPKPATLPIPIANQIAGSPTAGPRGDHRHD
jgi:hypothetical protein